MSPRIWLQKLKLAPNSKETSAKISVLVTILWTEPWICAQKLKFDHHKLSVNLAVSPQIGCFFKTAPLLFLSSYWNGHVSVTIRWINHNIQSTGPVGLTSLWGSVMPSPIYIWCWWCHWQQNIYFQVAVALFTDARPPKKDGVQHRREEWVLKPHFNFKSC